MSLGKRQPSCLGLNVLNYASRYNTPYFCPPHMSHFYVVIAELCICAIWSATDIILVISIRLKCMHIYTSMLYGDKLPYVQYIACLGKRDITLPMAVST